MQDMAEVYKAYSKTVYCFLLSRTGDAGLAEELTQETFYQAVKCAGRFDGSCRMSTWLCAIAKNQLCVYRRRNPKMERLEGAAADGGAAEAEAVQARGAAETQSAEASVLAQMSRTALLKKLHGLAEPYREVLQLRAYGALSFREIGEIFGKTENWARVTFYRGKEKLKEEMERDE